MKLLKFSKFRRILLSLTVSLLLCTMSMAVLPTLRSSAWDWESSAPWSIRTQTDSSRLSNSSFTAATSPDWVKTASGTYTPQSYDTDDYFSPNNMRLSCVVGGVWNSSDAEKLDVRVEVYDQNGGRIFYSDWTTNAILNVPIPRRTSYTYNIYVRRYGMDENFVVYASLIWTYEMYYRDEVVTQPTQAPFTLPSDWTNDTTVSAETTATVPTVTTVVSDVPNKVEQYVTLPEKVFSALNFIRVTSNNLFGLKYMTFIICFGIICALLSWLLH